MRPIHHIAVSAAVSALVWAFLRDATAAAVCFLTGILMDLDHLIDYAYNYGPRFRLKHFFSAFRYEAFENIFVFLHSWEFIALYFAILWLIDWQPVALGAVIGVAVHLGLDHFFNEHSRFAYFLSYRIFHGFSARHFYGPEEHARRIKRKDKQSPAENKKEGETK